MSEPNFYPPNHPYFLAKEDTPEELLYQFLRHCKQYVSRCGLLPNDSIYRIWNDSSLILPKSFTYDRLFDLLKPDYLFFSDRVVYRSEKVEDFYPPKKGKHKKTWSDIWQERNQYSRKYQKLPHHKKKDKEINQREVWRQFSGLYKDRAKRKDRSEGSRQSIQNNQERKLRRWTNRNIQRENYDAFHAYKQEKMFYEPWAWD
jgi:hypothetical protein